ncbi:MAG TPA: BCAM0308 family protein [Geobacteraceae bacterium]|nr:BCAM0308 family protein [Geobacteraceae bacterium]
MARLSHKTGVEEKGQRTARSTDVYLPKEGMEVSWCKKCGIIYRQKRWIMDPAELEQVKADPAAGTMVCPACQRMRDNVPGGVVTFSGEYLNKHEEEILELVKNIEAKSRAKNPLGRIMEIRQEGAVLTVSTTEDKLAQKLGRDIFRSHKGDLHFKWSEGENFVRVDWKRD